MKEYYVTFRMADGSVAERRVAARSHGAAAKQLMSEGLEVLEVSRAGVEDDDDEFRRVGSPARSALIAIALGVLAAGIFVALFWLRRRG